MGFDALVRKLVPIADKMTLSMQPKVTHIPFKSQTVQGTVAMGGTVKRPAHVELKAQSVRSMSGEFVMSKAKITFLRSVAIDTRDTLILPDGTTGPIIAVNGYMDPATSLGYVTEVYLG